MHKLSVSETHSRFILLILYALAIHFAALSNNRQKIHFENDQIGITGLLYEADFPHFYLNRL